MKTENKIDKYLAEAELPLRYANYHLRDNVLDGFTVDEVQTMIVSNIPREKITPQAIMKEIEDLIKTQVMDARFIAKKIAPEMAKVLKRHVK